MHCFSLTKIAPHSLVLAAAIYSVSIKPEDPRVYTQTYCKESALFFLSVTLSWPIAVLCHTPPVCTYSCGSTVEYCEHAIVARIYSRRPHTFHKNQIGVNNGRATAEQREKQQQLKRVEFSNDDQDNQHEECVSHCYSSQCSNPTTSFLYSLPSNCHDKGAMKSSKMRDKFMGVQVSKCVIQRCR